MLRITTTTGAEGTEVTIEGRLAGPWVEEMAACWRILIARQTAHAIRINLDAVTFVSAAGQALLRTLHNQGAVLMATECMMRAIVEQLTGNNEEEKLSPATPGTKEMT